MQLKTGIHYEYGPFLLDPAEHRLTRDGAPVPLTPRAFELLLFLVQNPGRLLTKDQIMQTVWPGSYVEEANLTVSISVLRKALGEKEGVQRYIETVPKKGYRFIAPVRELRAASGEPEDSEQGRLSNGITLAAADAPSSKDEQYPTGKESGLPPAAGFSAKESPSWTRTGIVAVGAVLLILLVATSAYFVHQREVSVAHPLAPQHSLAVLPLRNLRQDPNDDFLSYSLADAIITRLGPVSSLIVRPSSAIEKYKGQAIDPPKVGAELSVDTLLTGTFIHEGDWLRITYQLIDVKTEKILRMDVIDIKYDKLMTVQDAVTRQIIDGLALSLSSSEMSRMQPAAPINPLSYEYYLRGVDLMGSHEFPLAIEMLEKSAEIDPNYALTWAYLGQSYNSTASFQFGGREQYRKARASLERALALQPSQLEARMFQGNLLVDTGEVENAVPLLRQTQKNYPNNAALIWELGYAYRFAGMLRESVEECEQARRIDPFVKANGAVLNSYLYLGEYDKFLASLPDVDDSSFLLFYRGFGEYHQKKWAQAARDFDRAWRLDRTLYTQIGAALSDSIAHKDAEGLDLLHDLEKKIEQRSVGDPEGAYKVAQAYAVLGDRASALRMLRYSIENGFFPYSYFASDPLLENIRGEKEYPQLMETASKRQTAFRNRFF